MVGMVSKDIKWPVEVTSRIDPTLHWTFDEAYWLGARIEWWNSDIVKDYDEEECVITDAEGRKLGGRIEYTEVIELFVLESDPETET